MNAQVICVGNQKGDVGKTQVSVNLGIGLTSEGDDTYSVHTFNPALKRRLADFALKYPECCHLKAEDKKYDSAPYVIEKGRFSLRMNAPYPEDRRKAASNYAKKHGFGAENHAEKKENTD